MRELSYGIAYSCGQTIGWIKMPLGKEVGLGPGHIVLDGDPAPHSSPSPLSAHAYWPNGHPSQQLLSLLNIDNQYSFSYNDEIFVQIV